jgi:hypothetical protein
MKPQKKNLTTENTEVTERKLRGENVFLVRKVYGR